MAPDAIAVGVDVSVRSVYRWLEQYENARVPEDCEDDYRPGRPEMVGAAEEDAVVDLFAEGAEPTRRDVQQAVYAATGTEIGLGTAATTIHRALGLRYLSKKFVPQLSAKQIKRRHLFAREHGEDDWHVALFADEKTFEVGHQERMAWMDPDERIVVPHSAHPPKVQVWGAVGHYFKSELYFFTETLDADKLCTILHEGLPPTASRDCPRDRLHKWILVHDNDPKYKSRKAQKLLDTLAPDRLRDWPANSPDLNPMEDVWSELQRLVNRQKSTTIEELRAAIVDAWSTIDFHRIRCFTSSMPHRIEKLRRVRGASTGY